jgi:hypothetical protein
MKRPPRGLASTTAHWAVGGIIGAHVGVRRNRWNGGVHAPGVTDLTTDPRRAISDDSDRANLVQVQASYPSQPSCPSPRLPEKTNCIPIAARVARRCCRCCCSRIGRAAERRVVVSAGAVTSIWLPHLGPTTRQRCCDHAPRCLFHPNGPVARITVHGVRRRAPACHLDVVAELRRQRVLCP